MFLAFSFYVGIIIVPGPTTPDQKTKRTTLRKSREQNPLKMGNYTILQMFENPRIGRQARNFATDVPKILDLNSSSEQIYCEN